MENSRNGALSEKAVHFRTTWTGFLPKKAVVMASQAIPQTDQTPAPLAIPPTEVKISHPLETSRESLIQQLTQELQGCSRCKLCEKRTTIVIGEGNLHAELVFVGEGPGEQEDLQGRPFVGKAGQLLDKMIEAIGLKRSDVYIANVVKCRPPGNRNPEPDEITQCSPFLYRQLDVIRPKVVVALGKFAAQTLLQTDQGITRIRGQFFQYRGAKLMPTFHPAYLLRNPASKKEAWIDLQLVAKEIGLQIPKRG